MPRIPNRQSLPSQAAQVIQEMISSGDLHGLLPGERTLASQLQIGRDTLRAALIILEASGIISANEHGKRRRILSTARKCRTATKCIAFLSPKNLTQLPPWMLVEFDSLRDLLHQRGYRLQLLTPGLFHLKNPARKLETLLSDTDADAWILYQCPGIIQQWFNQQKIPALIRGYPYSGITIPFIDEDWEAAAYHAGTLLKRQGHERIGLLMPDSKLAGLAATEKGLRKSFPDTDAIIPIIEKGSAENVALALARTLRLEAPPTAIIATRSRHTLSIISWMAQQKLSIPQDLSLITITSEPWFEHLLPKPSHYFSDPAHLARTVVRSILPIAQGKLSSSTKKLLIPEYIPGETVAKR
ncbi:MAG: substrate-binding domain-containing protein [Akkermansiaceae bacterium]|jgi:DNA-binding LacI/PurR family transcriptional regulator